MELYNWRPVQDSDRGALAALDAACLPVDGPASVSGSGYAALLAAPDVALLCATREDTPGLTAVGWVQVTGQRARLGGRVHPAHRHRGLGTHLLRWGAAQAVLLGQPDTVIIRNEALTAGSVALYTQEGYTCKFIEQWMQRDLHEPLPVLVPPVPTVPWTADNAGQFYAAYVAGFSTRRKPGAPVQSAAEWISEHADDPDFRLDLSLLAQAGDQPVSFFAAGLLTIADLGQTVGWISQVAVDPAWRGRGLGAGLVVAVLAAFQREGFAALGLHVNIDNPEAIRLYERLGFMVLGQRGLYSRPQAC